METFPVGSAKSSTCNIKHAVKMRTSHNSPAFIV
jgi:hypothetical protein